ncbi:hypothetical protein, partial [Microcoleus sp.]|uniref:hypothetical protein n=1 Tax=Microcoleus sp. TaxID=44472 RepID=UPI00403E6C97
YSGSQKSEVCPMPYALCPMPYAHEYLIFLRKAILTPTLTPNCSRISACSLPLINSCLGRTRGQKPW